MSGLLCAGDVLVDRFDDNGNSTGLVYLGNVKKLAIEESAELKERISRQRDTYGQSLDSLFLKNPASLSLSFDELDKSGLSIALLGSNVDVNEGAGTVTDEVVVAKLDYFAQLAKRNLNTSGVVVTDSAGATTYVEGTDYEIHYRLGMIKAKSTGAITAAQSLKIDYTHSAVSGTRINGSARPTVRCRIILDGKNLTTQKPIRLEIYDAVITPGSEVDFMTDEFVELELSGSMRTPEGQTSPYYVELLDA